MQLQFFYLWEQLEVPWRFQTNNTWRVFLTGDVNFEPISVVVIVPAFMWSDSPPQFEQANMYSTDVFRGIKWNCIRRKNSHDF